MLLFMPFADVAPIGPLDEVGPMLWVAGGFLVLALVLGIVWLRRPKKSETDELDATR